MPIFNAYNIFYFAISFTGFSTKNEIVLVRIKWKDPSFAREIKASHAAAQHSASPEQQKQKPPWSGQYPPQTHRKVQLFIFILLLELPIWLFK